MKYTKLFLIVLLSGYFSATLAAEYQLKLKSSKISTKSRAYLQAFGPESSVSGNENIILLTGNIVPMTDAVWVDFLGDGQYCYFHVYVSNEEVEVELLEDIKENLIPIQIIKGINALNYYENLGEPVNISNRQIADLKRKLAEMKKTGNKDSVLVSSQIEDAVKRCFAIPTSYIKKNPESILSIRALQMMGNGGKGYPVSLKQLEKLFDSLSDSVKQSVGGVGYAKTLVTWKQDEITAVENLEKGNNFLKQNSMASDVITLPSGLQYKLLSTGNGSKPLPNAKLKVHYIGKLINNKKFDSSYDRNKPMVFNLPDMLPAWKHIFPLMNAGSNWVMYVPSSLGYGDMGYDGFVPANSVLIFEIDFIEIVAED